MRTLCGTILAAAVAIVAVAFSPLSAFAWGPGHDTVARCILEKLPPEWRARFKSEWKKPYLEASHLPDRGRASLLKAEDLEWLTANCGFKGDTYAFHYPPCLVGATARLLVPFDRETGVVRGEVKTGLIGMVVRDRGLLPLPFEHEGTNLLWKQMFGQAGDELYRVSVDEKQYDAGSYFFYVGKVVYRLPLSKAKGATRFGVYGRMLGHRKTHMAETLEVSADGTNWIAVENPWREYRNTCYSVDIPESLGNGDWLYVRIGGFGLGCDSSLAGFALMKGTFPAKPL